MSLVRWHFSMTEYTLRMFLPHPVLQYRGTSSFFEYFFMVIIFFFRECLVIIRAEFNLFCLTHILCSSCFQTKPDFSLAGKSICVGSPVITILLLMPSRVKNISFRIDCNFVPHHYKYVLSVLHMGREGNFNYVII